MPSMPSDRLIRVPELHYRIGTAVLGHVPGRHRSSRGDSGFEYRGQAGLLDAPAAAADRRALMFDPRFHDSDRLVASLASAMVAHQELNQVGAVIQQSVQASEALQSYALALWRATAAPAEFGVRLSDIDSAQLMLAGASPRGMSLLLRAARVSAWLDGRDHVTPEDVQAVFVETIAHRQCYQPVYEMRRHEISKVSSRSTRFRSANTSRFGKRCSRLKAATLRSAITRSSSEWTCGRARLISLKKKIARLSPCRIKGPGSTAGRPSALMYV